MKGMPIQQKRVLAFVLALVLLAGTYSLVFGPLHEYLASRDSRSQTAEARVPSPTPSPTSTVGMFMEALVPAGTRQEVFARIDSELGAVGKIRADGSYSCSFEKGKVIVRGDNSHVYVSSKELGEAKIDSKGVQIKLASDTTFSPVEQDGPMSEGVVYGMILQEMDKYKKDIKKGCE